MGEAELSYFQNDDLLAKAVAEAWLSLIANAPESPRKHLVALSGGRIAKKLFAAVGRLASRHSLAEVEFFWADERCVPPDDPESNYRLASECLFRPLHIKPESVHRIRGELTVAESVCAASEDLIKTSGTRGDAMPVLDLVLLGLGEDGHVASLFPGDPVTTVDRNAVYLAVEHSPKPPQRRVTLGNGPIYSARNVWVLASGRGKEIALRDSLSTSGRTPLARVIKNRATTKVFTDIPHSWASKIDLDGFAAL